MPTLITLTDATPYTPPEGCLGLTINGWAQHLPELLQVVAGNLNVHELLNVLQKEHGGLLGPGELIFATHNPLGFRTPMGNAYEGWLVFKPEE